MKSEKAKEILNIGSYQPDGMCPFSIPVCDAVNSVEVAEQEMIDKAIECHRLQCHKLSVSKFCCNNKYYEDMKRCDGDCNYVRDFKTMMK